MTTGRHPQLNPNIQNAIREIIIVKLHDQVMLINKELSQYKKENEKLKQKLMALFKSIIYDKTISKRNYNTQSHRNQQNTYFPLSITSTSLNKKIFSRLSQSQINLSTYLSTEHNLNDKDNDNTNKSSNFSKACKQRSKNSLTNSQKKFEAFNRNTNRNSNNKESNVYKKSSHSLILSDSMCNNTSNNYITNQNHKITLRKNNTPLNDSREILLYRRNSNVNSKRLTRTRNILLTPCKLNLTNSTSNIFNKSILTSNDVKEIKEPKEKQNQLIQIHRNVFSKSPFIRNKF